VTENPVNGTCDGNDFYASDFSSDTNGWRASPHIQNNGLWSSWYGGYDTNTYHMEYRDNNSNPLITCAWTTASLSTAAKAPPASPTRW
jgi:hypothetical protein